MEEFAVRAAPRVANKKQCVFKLHKDDQITWPEAKMRRENEYQPWQIKLGIGRSSRRFKAIKEGGVGENASYFIFYKPEDSNDTYEVCPIDEWYSVSATQRYKTLSSEEAEQKFEQRNKTLNLFTVMHQKKSGEANEEGISGRDSKAFKVSELDDWDQSGDDFDESDRDDVDEDDDKRKIRKKASNKKVKDEPEEAAEEGKEDSDEGDFEQREVDYMSDSSSDSDESGDDNEGEANVKSIAEEEALRDLLSTDDDEDADSNSPHKSKLNTDPNALGTVDIKQRVDEEEDDDSSDSDDYDVDEDKMDSLFMKKSLPAQLVKREPNSQEATDGTSNQNSTSGSQVRNGANNINNMGTNKRKATSSETGSQNTSSSNVISSTSGSSSSSSQPPVKRPCPSESNYPPPGSQEKLVEDLVKKYLRRKPTPTRVLLKDIKSKLKRLGAATSDMDNNLVQTIASIIKRLDPIKQRINDTIYFSLRQ